MLRKQLRPALAMTIVLMIITGGIYPGVVTALAQMLFPRQANGSLISTANGQVSGSALIGQSVLQARVLPSAPFGRGQRLR